MSIKNNIREYILTEANRLVNGDRNTQYGDPNADFERIAQLWDVLVQARVDYLIATGTDRAGATIITKEMVPDMMICLKLSRNTHMRKEDNYIDIAGYAACGADVSL